MCGVIDGEMCLHGFWSFERILNGDYVNMIGIDELEWFEWVIDEFGSYVVELMW